MDSAPGQLSLETADLFSQIEERLQRFEQGGVDDGHIDGIAEVQSSQGIQHLVYDLDADISLRFCGAGRQMGSDDDVIAFPENCPK